jgi:CheY-like chemotaxis protein
MFTFGLLCGTTLPARRSRMELSLGQSVLELPVILVIEDDEQIQSLVEDALIEGGFEPAIAASGEEAVTLLKSSSFIKERPVTYRALTTDINLKGMMNGWEVAKQAREIAGVSGRLHNWRGCRPVGIARRAEQHLTKKTFCTSAARDSGLPTAKHGYAR